MKIEYEFDPEELTGVTVAKSKRKEALSRCADYVKEQVLSSVGEAKSPVAGETWKRSLSPEYKKRKGKISSATFANMELYGDMLDSFDVVTTSRGLKAKVGSSQQDKADGHCNFSGKSKLPRRRFVPNADEGQTFRRDIVQGLRGILQEYEEES